MEGGLFLIFIVIALIARGIEAMTKGEKGKQQRRPQSRPRPEYERPHGTTHGLPDPGAQRPPSPSSGPRDGVPRDATEDAAAEMIPDELWEILTGRPKPQRFPQQQPVPRRLPEPIWDEEADRSEAESTAEVVLRSEVDEYEQRRLLEESQRERERRDLMERRARGREANSVANAPVVVSLEEDVPTAAVRHAAFHARLDAAPRVARPARVHRGSRAWLFAGDDLKRAIVLQEVLGPPKGLE